MPQKILFLDFDGVVLTDKSRDAYGYGVLDPQGVGYVKKLCEESGAKLVICSSWLHADDRDVKQMVEKAGLTPYLHKDWRIGKEGEDVQAIDKFTFIIDWVKAHGVKPKDIVILDDKLKKYPRITGMWKERVVEPNPQEGLQLRDYVLAKKLFGLPIDKISEQPILDQVKMGRGK